MKYQKHDEHCSDQFIVGSFHPFHFFFNIMMRVCVQAAEPSREER